MGGTKSKKKKRGKKAVSTSSDNSDKDKNLENSENHDNKDKHKKKGLFSRLSIFPFLFILVVIFAVGVRCYFFVGFANNDPQEDGKYIDLGVSVLEGRYDLKRFAADVRPSYLDIGEYFNFRIMIILVTALGVKIFGYNNFGIVFFVFMAGIGSVILAYLTGKMLHSKTAGIIAAAIMAVLPIEALYGTRISPYPLTSFFGNLGIYLFLRADIVEKDSKFFSLSKRNILFFLAGMAVGCSYLSTMFAFYLIMPFVAYVIYKKRFRKSYIYLILGALLIFSLEGGYYYSQSGDPFLRITIRKAVESHIVQYDKYIGKIAEENPPLIDLGKFKVRVFAWGIPPKVSNFRKFFNYLYHFANFGPTGNIMTFAFFGAIIVILFALIDHLLCIKRISDFDKEHKWVIKIVPYAVGLLVVILMNPFKMDFFVKRLPYLKIMFHGDNFKWLFIFMFSLFVIFICIDLFDRYIKKIGLKRKKYHILIVWFMAIYLFFELGSYVLPRIVSTEMGTELILTIVSKHKRYAMLLYMPAILMMSVFFAIPKKTIIKVVSCIFVLILVFSAVFAIQFERGHLLKDRVRVDNAYEFLKTQPVKRIYTDHLARKWFQIYFNAYPYKSFLDGFFNTLGREKRSIDDILYTREESGVHDSYVVVGGSRAEVNSVRIKELTPQYALEPGDNWELIYPPNATYPENRTNAGILKIFYVHPK